MMQKLASLAEIAKGRDHLNTAEYAFAVGLAPQTIRTHYSKNGHSLGIVPIKPSAHLLWPVAKIADLLAGGV